VADEIRAERPLEVKLPGAATHEGSSADLDTVAEVLGDAARAIEKAGVPYVLIGGLASAVLGRPRCSSDVDLLVQPEGAYAALAALAEAGFDVEETNPAWLFKGFRKRVLVDLLFKTRGDIYLDAEMMRRAGEGYFRGALVRVVPPEDLIVIKAIVHDEETPRHWGDALALLTRPDLDWEYLSMRARRAPHRVLSLLLYARSVDLRVPTGVLRRLAAWLLFDEDERWNRRT
jgi:predicted nucleotidyltransferase